MQAASEKVEYTGSIALARKLDKLTQSIAVAGFCGLVIVAILTFYDGSARYLGLPRVSGFNDYGELVYPIVIASCFPAGLLRQSNVTIRVLEKVVGPRVSMWFEALAAFVTLVFFGLLVWQFIVLGENYTAAARTTRTVEMLLAPWWWVATIIMSFCVPVQIYVTAIWTKAAFKGIKPAHSTLNSRESAEAI
ncbi:TRAP transporter small permease subunit [Sulfitobacter geojensis]|uniref:TRAP transporter small permease subunit n=1 Tax=Sulfitobacter geojensis TaxID=1342299 RepID=UPI000469D0D3|nr:TRAP transporter small permease subunit [Sulfitobacter geojensis]KHA51345.1 TRAP transporter [Sulfitobacter geojensis]NYI30248.1 TRAP-type C4-dicarboxylate transport system permease small subunit [Sulfitobacter geojensis]